MIRLPSKIIISSLRNVRLLISLIQILIHNLPFQSRCTYSLLRAQHFQSSSSCDLKNPTRSSLLMIKDRSISTAFNRHFDMVKKSNASADLTDWQTVYRFPLIVHARIFARSKLYLTLITLISAPNAIFLYLSGKFIAF